MMDRRKVLKASAAAGAASLLPAGLSGRAAAQPSRPFTFVSWGGALQETEKKAFIEPFFAKKGMKFAEASPTTYAKIKAQVEAKAVEWDLVTVGGQWMYQAKDQNLAEPMDYSVIKNDALDKAWKAEFGVYSSTGATIVAYNTKAFPAGQGAKILGRLLERKGLPRAAQPLLAHALQLRGRAAGSRRAARPDLSLHGRQDPDHVPEAGGDQAARLRVVDHGRAGTAALVDGRGRDGDGVERPHPRRAEGRTAPSP